MQHAYGLLSTIMTAFELTDPTSTPTAIMLFAVALTPGMVRRYSGHLQYSFSVVDCRLLPSRFAQCDQRGSESPDEFRVLRDRQIYSQVSLHRINEPCVAS